MRGKSPKMGKSLSQKRKGKSLMISKSPMTMGKSLLMHKANRSIYWAYTLLKEYLTSLAIYPMENFDWFKTNFKSLITNSELNLKDQMSDHGYSKSYRRVTLIYRYYCEWGRFNPSRIHALVESRSCLQVQEWALEVPRRRWGGLFTTIAQCFNVNYLSIIYRYFLTDVFSGRKKFVPRSRA